MRKKIYFPLHTKNNLGCHHAGTFTTLFYPQLLMDGLAVEPCCLAHSSFYGNLENDWVFFSFLSIILNCTKFHGHY